MYAIIYHQKGWSGRQIRDMWRAAAGIRAESIIYHDLTTWRCTTAVIVAYQATAPAAFEFIVNHSSISHVTHESSI